MTPKLRRWQIHHERRRRLQWMNGATTTAEVAQWLRERSEVYEAAGDTEAARVVTDPPNMLGMHEYGAALALTEAANDLEGHPDTWDTPKGTPVWAAWRMRRANLARFYSGVLGIPYRAAD